MSKILKSFWRKKKHHYHHDQNKNLSEEEKQKKVEYMRNYNLAHKEYLFGFYKVIGNWRFLGENSKNILAYKK